MPIPLAVITTSYFFSRDPSQSPEEMGSTETLGPPAWYPKAAGGQALHTGTRDPPRGGGVTLEWEGHPYVLMRGRPAPRLLPALGDLPQRGARALAVLQLKRCPVWSWPATLRLPMGSDRPARNKFRKARICKMMLPEKINASSQAAVILPGVYSASTTTHQSGIIFEVNP